MNKRAPLALLFLGFLVMAWSFVYYAANALPYPDATGELLSYQAAEAKKWGFLFTLGLLSSALGGVWLWKRSRAKKKNSDN